MLQRLTPWLLLFFCLALLALGATQFGPVLDHVAVALRFLLVVLFSLLLLSSKYASGKDKFLRSLTRWYRGE